MIKLAIVSPCYNEEEVLEESTTRLTALFDDLVAKKKISADSFVLFVNDGSKDRTWSIIKQLPDESIYKRNEPGSQRRTSVCHHGRYDDR